MRPITMQMAQFEADTQKGELLSFKNCKGGYFSTNDEYGLKVFGNSVQNGTPTPDNPIEIESVGELVASGENAGKYAVEIKICGENIERAVVVYLNKPLRRIKVTEGSYKGEYADYIDFARGVVVRYTGEWTFTGKEQWSIATDYTVVTWLGYYAGSNIEILNCKCSRSGYHSGWYGANWYTGATSYSGGGSGFMWNHCGLLTINEWKAQLAQWKEEGNPMKVVFALKTPTEEQIVLPQPEFIQGECNVYVNTSVVPQIEATALVRR